MKNRKEIEELWATYHGAYQRAKDNGERREELASAEICRVLEWVLA